MTTQAFHNTPTLETALKGTCDNVGASRMCSHIASRATEKKWYMSTNGLRVTPDNKPTGPATQLPPSWKYLKQPR
jgi:hypothetical protein